MPDLTTIESTGRLGNFPYRSGDESIVVEKKAKPSPAFPPNKPPRPPKKTKTGGSDAWRGDPDKWRSNKEKNKKLAAKQGFNKDRRKPY